MCNDFMHSLITHKDGDKFVVYLVKMSCYTV
jgi:hypothetical protein